MQFIAMGGYTAATSKKQADFSKIVNFTGQAVLQTTRRGTGVKPAAFFQTGHTWCCRCRSLLHMQRHVHTMFLLPAAIRDRLKIWRAQNHCQYFAAIIVLAVGYVEANSLMLYYHQARSASDSYRNMQMPSRY